MPDYYEIDFRQVHTSKSGDAIKEAQAKISATMMRLLHGALEKKRAA
jgi:hypothetical protein